MLESDLDELLNIYKSKDKFGKMIALSFAAQKYSKTVVMEAFNCSKWKVDEARKLQVFSAGIKTPDISKHNRLKLDINKCNRFLDFIFNNGLLQDVAYRTSVLKYTNGEKQVVPHAILVARFKHMVTYQKLCDVSFQPLSECTLCRILNELNSWQRKSLAGLDDTTADGLNGFKSLRNAIINFFGRKKNYLLDWSTQRGI